MRALCPTCGVHHEVVRILEDGHGEGHRDVYQLAPVEGCERAWLSDAELLEARARFGEEAIVAEPDDELA